MVSSFPLQNIKNLFYIISIGFSSYEPNVFISDRFLNRVSFPKSPLVCSDRVNTDLRRLVGHIRCEILSPRYLYSGPRSESLPQILMSVAADPEMIKCSNCIFIKVFFWGEEFVCRSVRDYSDNSLDISFIWRSFLIRGDSEQSPMDGFSRTVRSYVLSSKSFAYCNFSFLRYNSKLGPDTILISC